MKPRVYVDFNEMLSADEVLLSRHDTTTDSGGNVIELFEGRLVAVYTDDQGIHGKVDNLIADGTATRNDAAGWSSSVPWVLKIDHRGIRHHSEDPES